MQLLLVSVLMTLNAFWGQTFDSRCCRLDVGVRPNSTVLEFVVKNLEDVTILVARREVEFDLRVQIRGDNGREPELTELGKLLASAKYRGSVRSDTLGKGDTWKDTLDLRTLYVLEAGTYVVTVSRDVFISHKKLELKGNVKIEVLQDPTRGGDVR